MIMVRLSVNVDHVATLRQARGGVDPDPMMAAAIVYLAGANGITVHLRSDRRHINDRDVRLLREIVKTDLELNLEMAATEEMLKVALEVKPDQCTLVPEKPGELTTEGGLNVAGQKKDLSKFVKKLHDAGLKASIFVEPDEAQIKAAKEVGADRIELHTGIYARARSKEDVQRELDRLRSTAKLAGELGLEVNAGHDLNLYNIKPVATIPNLREVSIGHNLIARAILHGLGKSIKELLVILQKET